MKTSKFFILLFLLTSCGTKMDLTEDFVPSVLCPAGSTLIGVSLFASNHPEKLTIGNASVLAPAFIDSTHDVIIAPFSVGLNAYQKIHNYRLSDVFVWGNLYLVSDYQINDLSEIEGQEIASFQKGAIPQIVFESILNYNNITCDLNYLSNVEAVTASYLSDTANIIVTAEPSVQTILKKKPNSYVIDLQEEYSKCFGTNSYPQACVFVSGKYINKFPNYKNYIKEINDSITFARDEPLKNAEIAVTVDQSLNKLGVDTISKATKGCNFNIVTHEEQKNAIVKFIDNTNKIIGSNYEAPKEEFYIN